MSRGSGQRIAFAAALVLGTAAFIACNDTENTPLGVSAASSKNSTVSVTATDPSYGDQGQVGEVVTITGTGFRAGAQAAWQRNGVADPKITVNSTQFVSSTQLVANITIAPDAALDLYDVSVTNTDRSKGIGSLLFEVTNAILIQGTQNARGVNDNGEITGSFYSDPSVSSGNYGVGYFASSTGLFQSITLFGTGFKISPLGNAISAHAGSGNGFPYLFTRAGPPGTTWQATALPVDPTATQGGAQALAADPVTGQVALLGGREIDAITSKTAITLPIVWALRSGTGTNTSDWQRIVLPKGAATAGADAQVQALATNGRAAGYVGNQATVWEPNGSGGYALTVLASSGLAQGINSQGTLIAGRLNLSGGGSSAVYWQRSSTGAWSSAITLPGGCDGARDVADNGRIALNSCPFGRKSYPAFIDPPYTAPVRLSGLGPNNTIGQLSGISRSGQYITAQATVGGGGGGIYWKLY